MTHDALRRAALALPNATEDQPFGPENVVFRVGGKIFALLALDASPPSLNYKGDPEALVDQRERYGSVRPGWHMNKRHWNTLVADGEVPEDEVRAWLADAHRLVHAGLSKTLREALPL